MTKEEIDKVVKEIREHCRKNNCGNCEAKTIHGCVFMSAYPNEWFTTEEADKEESEKWVNFAEDLIPIMNETESEVSDADNN